MTDAPETHYVRSADGTKLAYQIAGKGPLDLIISHGLALPVDLLWDDPDLVRISRRLGAFSRTIWCEPRGVGASEGAFAKVSDVGEVSDQDYLAILDDAGVERGVFVGAGLAATVLIHLAVTHPDRVGALVLLDAQAHYVREPDYQIGFPPAVLDRLVAAMKEDWGTGAALEMMAPSRAADDRFRTWYSRGERLLGGPDETAAWVDAWCRCDVRDLLPLVKAPTLVIHREDDPFVRIDAGRYLADHIAGAKFVSLPGSDHLFFVGDTDALVDEMEEFLTGNRSGADADVQMGAVLFTDIVSSTELQASIGQREWSRLTDHHEAMVRASLSRHHGREIKTTGDGFLAMFDTTARAIHCTREILDGAKTMNLELRAGIHTGEVEVRRGDIGGLTVNIAKRISDLARSGEILVSETVRINMVGANAEFEDRGDYELKGVPGAWRLYAVKA